MSPEVLRWRPSRTRDVNARSGVIEGLGSFDLRSRVERRRDERMLEEAPREPSSMRADAIKERSISRRDISGSSPDEDVEDRSCVMRS